MRIATIVPVMSSMWALYIQAQGRSLSALTYKKTNDFGKLKREKEYLTIMQMELTFAVSSSVGQSVSEYFFHVPLLFPFIA